MTNQEIRDEFEIILRRYCLLESTREAIHAAIAKFADPPEGAVKVRAAVAMNKENWAIFGSSYADKKAIAHWSKLQVPLLDVESEVETDVVAWLEAYIVPPSVPTVQAEVEVVK